jgi:hypothetical protein
VTTQRATLQGLQTLRSELRATALIAASGEVIFGDPNSQVYHAVDTFLQTTRPRLTVRTDADRKFFGYCLLAGFLLWYGLRSDPDLISAATDDDDRKKRRIHSFESPFLIWGLVLGLCGLAVFRLAVPDAQAEIVEDENLPVLSSPAMLADIPDGEVVLVEGHLSENNETIFRDFVAYLSERYHDDSWHFYGQETPSFWLDVTGTDPVSERRLWLNSDKYGLESTILPREWTPDEPVDGKRVRYRGLGRGDLATIYGQVEQVNGQLQFTAWVVYGGRTIEDYHQGSQVGLTRLKLMGSGLVVVALLLIVIFIRKDLIKAL